MVALYTNNASTILASGITNSATSLTVQAGNGARFPSPTGGDYFLCTLQGISGTPIEIVKCTARSTDTFTIVRAQEGTTASAFNANDIVELRVTAGELTNMVVAGANSTITSLTGLTTALTVAQGGTGVTTSTGSGNNVLSASPTFSGTTVIPTTTITTLNAPSGVLATQNGMAGIAKAWVSFIYSSGFTIAGSFNVSSITYAAVGSYVVNFTTSMPNTGYAICLGMQVATYTGGLNNNAVVYPNGVTTDSVKIGIGYNSGGTTGAIDGNYVYVSVFSS